MLLLVAFIALLLTFTSAKSDIGSYIVYLGHINESLHVDSTTQIHYAILQSTLGSYEAAKESIVYSYKHGMNGFAARLTPEQANCISKLPGVISVFRERHLKLHTTHSWEFMGMGRTKSWFGSSGHSLWKQGKHGKDSIVGLIDSGIDPDSDSFQDHGMSRIPKRWKGTCEQGPGFNSSNCNRKLIGARYFYQSWVEDGGDLTKLSKDFLSPRDAVGHGTHTSSIAAGRYVRNASYFGLASGVAAGGAPKARLAMYKVSWDGYCLEGDLLAAYDAAVHDGVDVISVSIGLEETILGPSTIGALHAVRKGIVVVESAGNGGPRTHSLQNASPWSITVGNSNTDRSLSNYVQLGNHQIFNGVSLSGGTDGFKQLVSGLEVAKEHSTPSSSIRCIKGSWDPDKVKNKIVVCMRGEDNSFALFKDGAAGRIIYDPPQKLDNEPLASLLPSSLVSAMDGQSILSYINLTGNATAYISPATTVISSSKLAPIVAHTSSRGPSLLNPNIIKPDLVAPGQRILAAYPSYLPVDDDNPRMSSYNIMSGTSMACPHVSGIVALLKTYHRDWSPAAIKSALITTAYLGTNNGTKIEGSPFDYGAGHVNPNAAAHPGLVYDAAPEDYDKFLCAFFKDHKEEQNNTVVDELGNITTNCPSTGGYSSVNDFNYPSIAIVGLKTNKTALRRVTNVGDHRSVYRVSIEAPFGVSVTVEPEELVFTSKGQIKTFNVTFKVDQPHEFDYVTGYLTWRDHRHVVTSPIVVRSF